MKTGTKIRLTQDVERYPHFIAPQGATGTVVHWGEDQISVKLDEPIRGAEEWDNEVHWYADSYSEDDVREVFRDSVEVVEG